MKKVVHFSLSLIMASSAWAQTSVKAQVVPEAVKSPTSLGQIMDVSLYSSAPNLKLDSGKLLMDNDAAFKAKLDIIEKAKRGDTLRLVYYIFSDDESSSKFAQTLIEKSKQGVKVKLLLDLLQNYKRLDLFKAMEQASNGNIEVKFYGRPTRNMVMDAHYLAGDCKEVGCADSLLKEIDAAFKVDMQHMVDSNITLTNTGKSGLLLSGLYAKNPEIMALALSQGKGELVQNIKASSKQKPMTAEEKEGLKKVGSLIWKSKTGSGFEKVSANMQLFMLKLFMPDKINPVIDTIQSFLPWSVRGSKEYGRSRVKKGLRSESVRFSDWTHLSDYTHHKLILLNDREMVLGGRNIENSYHMKPNGLTQKYIFRDTDMQAQLKPSAASKKVADSFDRLFNFKPLTISTAHIDQLMPNDIVGNLDLATAECTTPALGAALAAAKLANDKKAAKQLKSELISTCAKTIFASDAERAAYLPKLQEANPELTSLPSMRSSAERQAVYLSKMQENAKIYDETWGATPQSQIVEEDVISLTKKDLAKATFNYLENNHFVNSADQKRIYGAKNGQSKEFGKQIHQAWVDGMIQTCQIAQSTGKPQEIIMHSAYVFFPSNILRTLGKMIDGTIPCSNVDVKIITNSELSTDLVPVNLYNMNTMKSLFDYIATTSKLKIANNVKRGSVEIVKKGDKKSKQAQNSSSVQSANISYYEYDKAKLVELAGGNGSFSLHTKLTTLGDDVIIGSANADVRSYAMDTNNAMHIQGASDLVSKYKVWLNAQIDAGLIKETTERFNKSFDQIYEEQLAILEAMKTRYLGDDSESKLASEENINSVIGKLQDTLRALNFYSPDVLKRRELISGKVEISAKPSAVDSKNVPALNKTLIKKLDRLMQRNSSLSTQKFNEKVDKEAEKIIQEEVMTNYDKLFQAI